VFGKELSCFENFEMISTFKYAVALSKSCGGSDEESLRRLGKILHLSSSRSLIVKCDESRFVKLGTKVCDSKLKEVGKVQDLFGPVTSPYVSVRPTVSSPAKFVHRIVYSFD
jgi:rRNA processing protein Gar1